MLFPTTQNPIGHALRLRCLPLVHLRTEANILQQQDEGTSTAGSSAAMVSGAMQSHCGVWGSGLGFSIGGVQRGPGMWK